MNFVKGMDLSTLAELEKCGAKYYDNGEEKDLLEIMKSYDVDKMCIRDRFKNTFIVAFFTCIVSSAFVLMVSYAFMRIRPRPIKYIYTNINKYYAPSPTTSPPRTGAVPPDAVNPLAFDLHR